MEIYPYQCIGTSVVMQVRRKVKFTCYFTKCNHEIHFCHRIQFYALCLWVTDVFITTQSLWLKFLVRHCFTPWHTHTYARTRTHTCARLLFRWMEETPKSVGNWGVYVTCYDFKECRKLTLRRTRKWHLVVVNGYEHKRPIAAAKEIFKSCA
jgi:hypothetical protein